MTFNNYKSLKIGNWNFRKLVRASDGLILFEKSTKPYDAEILYLERNQIGVQYIDTGILPSFDMEFRAKVYTPNVADHYFCSLRKDRGNTRYYLLNLNNSTGYATTKSVWPGTFLMSYSFLTEPHKIKSQILIDKVVLNVDGNETTYNDSTSTLYSANRTLPLFGGKINDSATPNASSPLGTRCYYAKFYKAGELVGDFIPVRKGTVGYMYDKVSGKMFGNVGSGSFKLGPDIIENPYVTDGLIAMWDGEWNSDLGEHWNNTSIWRDIISGYDLKQLTGTTPNWEEKANVINGKWGIMSPELQTLFKAANRNDVSYEICFSAEPTNMSSTPLGFENTFNGVITYINDIGDWCWSGSWIRSLKFVLKRYGTLTTVRNGQTQYTNLYADAILTNGKTGTTGNPDNLMFGIGYGYGSWNNAPTGLKIHCIRLYNRQLTLNEILKNRDTDISRFFI